VLTSLSGLARLGEEEVDAARRGRRAATWKQSRDGVLGGVGLEVDVLVLLLVVDEDGGGLAQLAMRRRQRPSSILAAAAWERSRGENPQGWLRGLGEGRAATGYKGGALGLGQPRVLWSWRSSSASVPAEGHAAESERRCAVACDQRASAGQRWRPRWKAGGRCDAGRPRWRSWIGWSQPSGGAGSRRRKSREGAAASRWKGEEEEQGRLTRGPHLAVKGEEAVVVERAREVGPRAGLTLRGS